MSLLHIHEGGDFFSEVVLDACLETLRVFFVLFITYLIMELIEHKAPKSTGNIMRRAGRLAPALGGALGALPQCGFSSMAAGLFSGRVVSLGTLVAVFLSTSDEMLAVLIGTSVRVDKILLIIVYKVAVGIFVGFMIDIARRILGRGTPTPHIESVCEEDGCHCERGIFRSALHHTVTVSIFILIVTLGVSSLVFFIGEEALASMLPKVPVLSHLVASLVGLIPSCASSVLLTELALSGIISTGAMLSGLFAGAGTGLIVLFRVNKPLRENLFIIALLVIFGTLFGMLAELFPALSVV